MSVEHGEFSISLEGKIIKTKLIGSFNEFGAKRYAEAVIEVLDQYNIWVNQQNMLAKAFVFDAAILATIMKNMSPSMKADNIQMFKTLEAAESWLEEVLQHHAEIRA